MQTAAGAVRQTLRNHKKLWMQLTV